MEPSQKKTFARLMVSQPPGWLTRVPKWGKEAMIRAAIACAEWALPTPLGDDLQVIEDAVSAAQHWCDDPSEASRVGARMAHEDLQALAASLEEKGVVDEEFRFELDVTLCAVESASESRDAMVEHLYGELVPRIEALEDAEHCIEVIRQLLLAWAQGKADPRS